MLPASEAQRSQTNLTNFRAKRLATYVYTQLTQAELSLAKYSMYIPWRGICLAMEPPFAACVVRFLFGISQPWSTFRLTFHFLVWLQNPDLCSFPVLLTSIIHPVLHSSNGVRVLYCVHQNSKLVSHGCPHSINFMATACWELACGIVQAICGAEKPDPHSLRRMKDSQVPRR